jgi:predicted nucleic acid-binding protein
MDTFDADVLIYSGISRHPLGRRVLALFHQQSAGLVGAGSVLLLPEVLSKSRCEGAITQQRILTRLLARLDLRPVDLATAELATELAAKYRLRAAGATHLATAVGLGADRFITNNQRDFPRSITEVEITYPVDLPDVR